MEHKGTLVFSSGKAGDFDIWTLSLETGELKQLTCGEFWNDSPKWSPDGKSIAFISNESGVPELWRMDESGKNRTQITNHNKYHADPCWTPDGKRIAYVGNVLDGDNLDIFIVNADGTGDEELLVTYPGWGEAGPCFSPDGKALLLSSSRSGNDDIWLYDLASKNWTQLTSHPARDFYPVFSPDGKQIAFISERSESEKKSRGDSDVYVMNRDGSGLRKLTSNSGSDRFVAWSPCGKYVVCCAGGKGGTNERLSIVSVDAQEPVDFEYDRASLESEIQATTRPNWFFRFFLPEQATRAMYGADYFGSERCPDWKK